MYDNCCKYLIEAFPEDFATWLLGESIPLAQLSPQELGNEPLRADALVLMEGRDVILHLEFQTDPKPDVPFRLADYYLRIRRKFKDKRIRQVVIYLRPTQSSLVYQEQYESEVMTHRFEVVRLWEQPKSVFWNALGLLPFAVLSQSPDQEDLVLLQAVKDRIEELAVNVGVQGNLETATAVFAGLKLEPEVIRQVMRSKTMRESLFYQDILREGELRGIEQGKRQERSSLLQKAIPILRSFGVPVDRFLEKLGLTLADAELPDDK